MATNIFALHAALDVAERQLAVVEVRLTELSELLLDPHTPPQLKQRFLAEAEALGHRLPPLTAGRNEAKRDYEAALAADPLHEVGTVLPLALLPVRIETAYLPGAEGTDLVVRVYPDDIHVDAHEEALTDTEAAAGARYWRAVWGAGSNAARLSTAWQGILGELKPSRAAWAVRALRPAVPRPTDESPSGGEQPEPPLRQVAHRAAGFSRAALTSVLPDKWQIIGYRDGHVIVVAEGRAIPDSLNVSFGPPGAGGGAPSEPFDEASRWLVDLDAAVEVGMAVRIPMTGPDLTLDQLFVIGVAGRLSPDESARRLESVLAAHEYTRGLGFLPPRTPTTNTSASRSAWQLATEPPTPAEVEAARDGYVAASRQNAAMVAGALGIDGRETLSAAPHALDDQQTGLTVLQRQLWPCLGARALSLLFTRADVPPGGSVGDARWTKHAPPPFTRVLGEHAVAWVRSRGTLPILRIGNQPYGLLPTTSLADWVAAAEDPIAPLVEWLRLFRPYWLAGVGNVPRVVVGADANPDTTVVNVLGRLPVAEAIVVRSAGDPSVQVSSNRPFPVAAIPELPVNSELALSAPAATSQRLPVPIVADPAEDRTLMVLLRDLALDSLAVLEQRMPRETWATKYQSLIGAPTFPGARADLFNSLVLDSFLDPLAPTDSNSIMGFLLFGALFFDPNNPEFMAAVARQLPLARTFVTDFAPLADVDPAFYETAVKESIDICSHRYDAWVTSLAARRLAEMRTAAPAGVLIGGYGWLEDLAPRTDLSPVADPPPGFTDLFASPRQHYIHAPSLHHAATAAVLRAGYDSHDEAETLGVNLVSRRVRIADWLATGVRNGQTLSALLGYRFERGLHDAELDALIEGFRAKHPLPLPDEPDADVNGPGAREAIEARNVVDGLDLYRQRDAVRAQFAATPKVGELLDDLADAVDALGDLLLAESVHHLVGGNPLKAGLAADTIGRGESLPDRFDVVRTPRSGRPVTWHVGLLLPAEWRGEATGWQSSRPRAAAAPQLEAWSAALLGNANRWDLSFDVTEADGTTTTVRRTLDSFNLSALDVVLESNGQPSQLERRLIDEVTSGQPDRASAALRRTPPQADTLGLAELLGLAGRLRTLLASSTLLGPQHLQGPDSSPVLGLDVAELQARSAALVAALGNASVALRNALNALNEDDDSDPQAVRAAAAAIRAALRAVADIGILAAYPESGFAEPDSAARLAAQAASVLGTIEPITESELPSPPDAGASASDMQRWLDQVTQIVQSILGKAVPVVPTHTLPAGSVYAAAMDAEVAPIGANRPAVLAWMRRVARVRSRVAALHDTLMATDVLGTTTALTTAQLPVQKSQWIGLPFDKGTKPETRVALVLATPVPVDPAGAFCGLAVDGWSEPLPGITSVNPARGHESVEMTGVAFTVDAPDACAPQAILLAVPATTAPRWSTETLTNAIRETLELAKIRGVDLGDLPRLGRILPAIQGGHHVDDMLKQAGLVS